MTLWCLGRTLRPLGSIWRGKSGFSRLRLGGSRAEALGTAGFRNGHWDLRLWLSEVRLVIDQSEVDVVILRFTTNTKTPSLQAGEKDADEFTEAGRVENGDPLGGTSRRVIGIDSAARHGAFALGAYRVDPEHGEYLSGPFGIGASLIAVKLLGNILQATVFVGGEEVTHLQFVVGTRSGRARLLHAHGSSHGVFVVTVHQLAIFGKAVVGEAFGG